MTLAKNLYATNDDSMKVKPKIIVHLNYALVHGV
jgi:hypothetical protein